MTFFGTKIGARVPDSADGLQVTSRRGTIGGSAMAQDWVTWVNDRADPAELEFGKRIARKHQVYSLEVVDGLLTATVAEVRAEPLIVTLSFAPPPTSFWDSFTRSLLNNPVAIALLFANRCPDDLQSMIEESNGVLPPENMVEDSCSCGSTWCRHAIAAHCVFAERLDEAPWLVLELLGRSRIQLCNAVREFWGDDPIPEGFAEQRRKRNEAQPFYGDGIPNDTSLAMLSPFDVFERLGVPPFFPAEERNVKQTLEKLYRD